MISDTAIDIAQYKPGYKLNSIQIIQNIKLSSLSVIFSVLITENVILNFSTNSYKKKHLKLQ